MKQIFILGFISLLLGMGSCVEDNFVNPGYITGVLTVVCWSI